MKITISEGLGWMKTLTKRYEELFTLRNHNSVRTSVYGRPEQPTTVTEPTYDVKALDRLVARIAREIRLLDESIKHTNAATKMADYEKDDAILGEIELT